MTTNSTSQSSKSTQNGAVTKTDGEDKANGASQKPETGSAKKAGHSVAGVLTRIFRVNLAERRLLTGLLVLASLYNI